MKRMFFSWAILLPVIAVPFAKADDSTSGDKSQYTLLNPTPTELMRPWYTDNAGETAYTIDAGHFEGDVTAFSYSYFHRDYAFYSRTSKLYSFGSTQVKAGLLDNVDFEILITPYSIYTDKYYNDSANLEFRHGGVSDTETRIKWNVWGNDGGPTALAVGGLMYWPTGTGSIDDEQYEPGAFVNFQAELPADFELRTHHNVISFLDYENNTPTRGREYSFQNEISLIHSIAENVSGFENLKGYVQFNTYAFTTGGRDWDGNIEVGVTYRFRGNLELYGGLDFGVHGLAYDYSPFIGISALF